jgi:hypothetical protein
VGRNGTVVSLPQCEQTAVVSTFGRGGKPCLTGTAPTEVSRLVLQVLQRLGSFLNCLSWKKSCSPAVKTKSAPQSIHFRVLSWNSIRELLWPSPIGATLWRATMCDRAPCFRLLPLGSALRTGKCAGYNLKIRQENNSISVLIIRREGRNTAVTSLTALFLLFALFFAATFAGQRFLNSLLLAWLQVKGVTFTSLMVSSCSTLRLNRPRAFSSDSPSCNRTSAN